MNKLVQNPDLGLLIFRVTVGLSMAFAHGMGKLPPAEGFIGAVAGMGFPLAIAFAWGAALSEFLGGIFIAMGLLTRWASLLLGLTMGVAAFVAHAADPFAKKEMAILYLVSCVLLIFTGAGKFSLDKLVRKTN